MEIGKRYMPRCCCRYFLRASVPEWHGGIVPLPKTDGLP